MLGGLAVRLGLTFEHLEDLQLALAALLEWLPEDGEVMVRVRVAPDELVAAVGPFDERALADELELEPAERPGLHRVLETVADRVELVDRDGARWVELTKRIARDG